MQSCLRKKTPGYGLIGRSFSRRPSPLWRDYVATTSSGFTRKTQERFSVENQAMTSNRRLNFWKEASQLSIQMWGQGWFCQVVWQGIGNLTYTAVTDHLYRTRGRMLLIHQSRPKNDWFMSDPIVLEPHLDMKNFYFMTACCLIFYFYQFSYV